MQELLKQVATLQVHVAELQQLKLVERLQGIEGDIVLFKHHVEALAERVSKVETQATQGRLEWQNGGKDGWDKFHLGDSPPPSREEHTEVTAVAPQAAPAPNLKPFHQVNLYPLVTLS